MKHLKFIIIILILFSISICTLIGCKNKELTQNYYINGKDYQYMYFTQGFTSNIAESKNGYYFLSGQYLYYADKKTMKPVILCNKPNCLHDKETDPTKITNCDAFVGTLQEQFLAYYDGSLYTLSTIYKEKPIKYELIKLSEDGTNRKSILQFDSLPSSIVIHRGKVYYSIVNYDKNQKSNCKMYEFNLDKVNSKSNEIYVCKLDNGNVQDLYCYGNSLFFREYSNSKPIDRCIRYDLITKKINRLFTTDDNSSAVYAVFKNKIYYSLATQDSSGNINEGNYYVCDLDGKNSKEAFGTNYIDTVLSDQHSLYIYDQAYCKNPRNKEEQSLSIIDTNGKIINSTKTGTLGKNTTIICGGDSHLFISTFSDNKYKIFYADKKQFTSGNIELKPFFEIDQNLLTKSISTSN